nr:hypothetical protein [uncultured Flavobacterium sp.]
MKRFFVLLLFVLPFVISAQAVDATSANTVGNLKYIMDVPLCGKKTITPDPTGKFKYNDGCGDHLYWQVVGLKLRAVPHLIALIENEEPTQAKLPKGKGYYKTGDVAVMALREIVHDLPVEEFVGYKMADFDNSAKFFQKALKDAKKRTALKDAIQKWFDDSTGKLIYEKGNTYGNCECVGKHPVGGYTVLKKTELKKDDTPVKTE